jgi:hypothetical protein
MDKLNQMGEKFLQNQGGNNPNQGSGGFGPSANPVYLNTEVMTSPTHLTAMVMFSSNADAWYYSKEKTMSLSSAA